MPYCMVKLCGKCSKTSSLQKDGISFHRFPKCPTQKQIWIEATKQSQKWIPATSSVICSRHFKPECFKYTKNNRRLLFESAIPTLYLPNVEPNTETNSMDTSSALPSYTPPLQKQTLVVKVNEDEDPIETCRTTVDTGEGGESTNSNSSNQSVFIKEEQDLAATYKPSEASGCADDKSATQLGIPSTSQGPSTLGQESRRVIEIIYFFNKLKEISNHNANCRFGALDIVEEHQVGLLSHLTLQCKLCSQRFIIETDPPTGGDVNHSAVAGAVKIGCSQTQLQEFLSSMSLPTIPPKIYNEAYEEITNDNYSMS